MSTHNSPQTLTSIPSPQHQILPQKPTNLQNKPNPHRISTYKQQLKHKATSFQEIKPSNFNIKQISTKKKKKH